MDRLFEKLRERHTGEWALGYAVGAAIVQDTLGNAFDWPPAVMPVITIVLVAGLFCVVVVSWFHGEEGRQPVTATEVFALGTIIVLAGGLAVPVARNASQQPVPPPGQTMRASGQAEDTEAGDRELDERGAAARLAVVPWTITLGDDRDEQFASLLHEEVISRLAQFERIEGINRASIENVHVPGMSPSEVAAVVNAGHTVTGTWRRTGDRARVSVEFSAVGSTTNAWAESYGISLDPEGAEVEELAQTIVEFVDAALRGDNIPTSDGRALDPGAHLAFLYGQRATQERLCPSLARGMTSFSDAISEDPEYARAYAALANNLVLWVTYNCRGLNHFEAYSWASNLADRALELSPNLAEAHLARAFMRSKAWAPSDLTESDFLLAYNENPESPDVLGFYAFFLARDGRYERSLELARRALELDPETTGRYFGYAFNAIAAGELEAALETARGALEITPGLELAAVQQAIALVALGRAEECLDLELSPRYRALAAVCLHAAGREEEAEAVIGEVVADAARGEDLSYVEAYYAWTGDIDEVLRWLNRSYGSSPNGPDFRVIESPLFDGVRETSELDDQLREMRAEAWNRVVRGTSNHPVTPEEIRELATSVHAAATLPTAQAP